MKSFLLTMPYEVLRELYLPQILILNFKIMFVEFFLEHLLDLSHQDVYLLILQAKIKHAFLLQLLNLHYKLL
jgi:hypothetical protein